MIVYNKGCRIPEEYWNWDMLCKSSVYVVDDGKPWPPHIIKARDQAIKDISSLLGKPFTLEA